MSCSPWTAGPAFAHTDILTIFLLTERGSVSRTIFHQLLPELLPGQRWYRVRCLVNENEGTRKRGRGRGIHATGHFVKFQKPLQEGLMQDKNITTMTLIFICPSHLKFGQCRQLVFSRLQFNPKRLRIYTPMHVWNSLHG